MWFEPGVQVIQYDTGLYGGGSRRFVEFGDFA